MMAAMKRSLFGTWLFLLGAAACGCEPKTQAPAVSGSTVAQRAEVPEEHRSDDAIVTKRLSPESFLIDVASLPKPYATESASKSPDVVEPPEERVFYAPDGFRVSVFASDLDAPRWLHALEDGSVLVTETRAQRIVRLVDKDGDGVADARAPFASSDQGLTLPFGMAHTSGHFYLGNDDEVLEFSWSDGQTALKGRGKRVATLPGGGYRQHWTRNVLLAPSGDALFVSIGSRSNVDAEPLPRASVQRLSLANYKMETVASGLRNPVGMALHPKTNELYVTVNERDKLGDDLVPDYFTRIREGDFFGWPYAYLRPDLLDPRHMKGNRSKAPEQAAATKTPDVLFQAHSAALGLTFYDAARVKGGTLFPARYQRGAYVAFRGSWNRSSGTGYKIVFVPFADGRPTGAYEDFVTGFLIDPKGPTTWGRPVGLLQLGDGSLLFTEEANGFIYRVAYAPKH